MNLAPSLTVTEFNDIDALRSLASRWNELAAVTPETDFFRTFAWLETYWRCFGDEQKLRVLVIGNLEQPQGIVPLVVRREKTGAGRLRVLTYPLDGWGAIYGPIGPKPKVLLTAAMQYISETHRDWDIAELRWTVNHEDALSAFQRANMQSSISLTEDASLLELAGDWEAYWMNRTSKWRNNVRRCGKKMAQHGEIRHLRYRPLGAAQDDNDPRWDLFEACVDIASHSWQDGSTTGTTLSNNEVQDFLRAMHETAVQVGGLDLNLLYLADKPVAFAYNYYFEGAVYGLRQGFDSTLSRDGAGTVLTWRMIEDSYARGDKRIDLGPEHLECKRKWLTSVRDVHTISHYPTLVPTAQLLRMKRWLDVRRGMRTNEK